MYDLDMKTETEWLTAADEACYSAKREGRGCMRVATRPNDDTASRAAG
jgi:GGDEF domain-containing protein